jgi:thiol-disulfide isomerase/thioredoxin
MRLRISLLTASLLAATPVLAVFNDVVGHPYESSIQYVLDHGIVSGYPDRTYRPEQVINRAEFTKIVIGARFSADREGCAVSRLPFPDVPEDSWFAQYVCVAHARGIVAGYADGTFKPERAVNAAEAAKIIATSYGIASEPGTAVWYQPYIDAIKNSSAYPPTISDVSAGLTRGEMAYIIHRLNAFAELPSVSGKCKVAGCSGQLCVEEDDDGISTCEWREEYACYETATCARQSDGYCGWTMTDELSSCLEGDRMEVKQDGVYTIYTQAAVQEQIQPYVLYFHADWCPYCQQHNSFLEDHYGDDGRDDSYSVFKINYDVATELKAAYGVTTQDTFILVDTQGDEISRVSFPSQVKLKEFVTLLSI